MPGIMCYRYNEYLRLDKNKRIVGNGLVLGNHKEDKHKHNHVQQPGLLNLPHKRAGAWEEGQEEPYELGVE